MESRLDLTMDQEVYTVYIQNSKLSLSNFELYFDMLPYFVVTDWEKPRENPSGRNETA